MLKAKAKISGLAVKYKNHNGNPPMNTELEEYIKVLRAFLPWLENDVQMTPTLRDRTQIHKALEVLCEPRFKVPEEFSTRARSILNQFESDNWGANSTLDSDGEGHDADSGLLASPISNTSPASHSSANVFNAVGTMRLPRPGHPIWGLHGIMHGVAIKPGRRTSYALDPRYLASKRNPKVFGHNGLTPGAWWPFQIVALFHGAHGASMKGIAGDAQLGTWSVVLSGGAYEGLDSDGGDVIWYSGDGAHDNEDPTRIVHASNATQSLHTSLSTRNPVRVLRSAKGKTKFAPKAGIRYDGLYCVIATRHRKNEKGGLYEQFKLERVQGQQPLREICLSVPTANQLRDFNRIDERY
jgi:hypothetical protein